MKHLKKKLRIKENHFGGRGSNTKSKKISLAIIRIGLEGQENMTMSKVGMANPQLKWPASKNTYKNKTNIKYQDHKITGTGPKCVWTNPNLQVGQILAFKITTP